MTNIFLTKSDFAVTELAVHSFEPLGFVINAAAKKLWKNYKKTARGVSALQYLTNPVDRAIQILATPLFATASFIYKAHEGYSQRFGYNGSPICDKAFYLGKKAVTFLPTVGLETLKIWIPLAVNAAIHLFPFKVISAFKDNRPHDFFYRRDYHRINYKEYPTFLLNAFSPLWSDKTFARNLANDKAVKIDLFQIDRLVNHAAEIRTYDVQAAAEIRTYDVQAATEGFIDDSIDQIEADDLHLENHSRDVFFTAFEEHARRVLRGQVQLDDCKFLRHLEKHAGLELAFFLPEGLQGAEKIAELECRYGGCLNYINELKGYYRFQEGLPNSPDIYGTPSYAWVQRVEAAMAHTYQKLTNTNGQPTKSARADQPEAR